MYMSVCTCVGVHVSWSVRAGQATLLVVSSVLESGSEDSEVVGLCDRPFNHGIIWPALSPLSRSIYTPELGMSP